MIRRESHEGACREFVGGDPDERTADGTRAASVWECRCFGAGVS
ncbi:MAG: hypothetical protein AVDCRST_MAG87-701 [uncultured Thermomicrobiales bacterium]|uniref:Uncharacterized protein n=1 Tax=uncultured Thermomicrobiales bacterium TaxID=1645740 RepID=A0A6J4UFE8_9BACT|nr:MAG: hypothetical protein AVDCRST_MAG87-701 [uncultured Thermomicrobiales bacterium]